MVVELCELHWLISPCFHHCIFVFTYHKRADRHRDIHLKKIISVLGNCSGSFVTVSYIKTMVEQVLVVDPS